MKATTPSRKAITSTALADLLEGYRDEIVAALGRLLYSMEDSHYRERPVTELQQCAQQSIAGFVQLFRSGSHDLLLQYSEEICERRAEQGFDISEVIEGHLLLDEAVLPIVRRECQWDTDDDAALEMAQAVGDRQMQYSALFNLATIINDRGEWIQAIEIKPGARAQVHHVLAYTQPAGEKPMK